MLYHNTPLAQCYIGDIYLCIRSQSSHLFDDGRYHFSTHAQHTVTLHTHSLVAVHTLSLKRS